MLPLMDQIQIQNDANTVEESFQQLTALKLEHYSEMAEINEQLSVKLSQVNANMLLLEKFKYFKIVLDRLLTFLDLKKEGLKACWPYLKDRFKIYEQEIINIIQIKKEVPHGQLAQIINQYVKLNIESDQVGPTTELNSELNIGTDQTENMDWRLAFRAEARQRAINWIMDTLKGCLKREFSGPDGLEQLQKSIVRFEERIFNSASSQEEYTRKISQKMHAAKKKTEKHQINIHAENPNFQSQINNNLGLGDMQTQTGMSPADCLELHCHSADLIGEENADLEPPQKKTKRGDVRLGILNDNLNIMNEFDILEYQYQPWW